MASSLVWTDDENACCVAVNRNDNDFGESMLGGVMVAMETHPHDPLVQYYGLGVLRNLSYAAESRNRYAHNYIAHICTSAAPQDIPSSSYKFAYIPQRGCRASGGGGSAGNAGPCGTTGCADQCARIPPEPRRRGYRASTPCPLPAPAPCNVCAATITGNM